MGNSRVGNSWVGIALDPENRNGQARSTSRFFEATTIRSLTGMVRLGPPKSAIRATLCDRIGQWLFYARTDILGILLKYPKFRTFCKFCLDSDYQTGLTIRPQELRYPTGLARNSCQRSSLLSRSQTPILKKTRYRPLTTNFVGTNIFFSNVKHDYLDFKNYPVIQDPVCHPDPETQISKKN